MFTYKTNWGIPQDRSDGNKKLDYFQLSGNDFESRDPILSMFMKL